jgi:hypothetical protein
MASVLPYDDNHAGTCGTTANIARKKQRNMQGNIPPIDAVECPTLEKGEEQAFYLTIMNQWAFRLDDDYLLEAANQTRRQAYRYDAAAVLNRQWNEHHSKVLNAKADALEHIAKYIKANKRVSELENLEADHVETANELANLFR